MSPLLIVTAGLALLLVILGAGLWSLVLSREAQAQWMDG